MINIPLEQIKEKIKQKSDLSEKEIDEKIEKKLKELSGLVSKEGAAHILANEMGIDLIKTENIKVKDLLAGMRNIEINSKVVDKYELRDFDTGERKGKVANFLLGDETGVVRAVLWNQKTDYFNKFDKGDILKIKKAHVRDNQGRKELHLSSQESEIEVNPKGVDIKVKEKPNSQYGEAKRKKLADLKEDDSNIEVLATIVQVYDPRFFEVCPECNKRVRLKEDKYVCNEHGAVEPKYNYVMNMYLDDGTENIRTVFWSNQIEKLLGKTREEMLEYKDDVEKFAEIKQDLLGKMIKVVGNVNKNENFDRMELVAKLVFPNPDPEEELEKLDEEIEKEEEKEGKKEESESEEKEPEEKPKQEKKEEENKEKDEIKKEKKPEPKKKTKEEEPEEINLGDEDLDIDDEDLDDLDLDEEDEDVISIDDL